jgi:hypothetical protein
MLQKCSLIRCGKKKKKCTRRAELDVCCSYWNKKVHKCCKQHRSCAMEQPAAIDEAYQSSTLRRRCRRPACRVATVLVTTTVALNLTACAAFSSCGPCSLLRTQPLLKPAAAPQQRHTVRTSCLMKVLTPQTAGNCSGGRSVAISTMQAALDAAEKRDWKRSLTLFHLSLTTGRKPRVSASTL